MTTQIVMAMHFLGKGTVNKRPTYVNQSCKSIESQIKSSYHAHPRSPLRVQGATITLSLSPSVRLF